MSTRISFLRHSPLSTLAVALALGLSACATAVRPQPPATATITSAVQAFVERNEIAGAVTLVADVDGVRHLGATGFANTESKQVMGTDALFWIASMTKPITATAILMLQDQGKLSVDDPVAKYLPEFAKILTADGAPSQITLKHLLTHSSGLAESTQEERDAAKSLADLIPGFTSRPLQFAPGSRWAYCQSGINTLGRIIEVVSGEAYPTFLQQRLFTPLGMVDTTFYPDPPQVARLATTYKREGETLTPAKLPRDFDPANIGHYPAPNGGLFSTASDYGRFLRMLLNNGSLDGHTYLSKTTVQQMRTVASGELKTGFTEGNSWGLGVCVVREPQGVSAALSPGSFGHGGAFGTQAWVDPVKKVAYLLMVQRSNFPNSDGSEVRKAFQDAAALFATSAR
ncbi:MAG TPA: serine hydrolase domain-containing protein [Planctomycetota bacterium]|nr:serine hydrolase domain-containing protein [Planctomycetota bacterium]